ncbi:MAG: hypothetical protein AAB462_04675 [Patescibacteria group bacterium]
MRMIILLGIIVFSTIGGWIGAAMTGGNWLSIWSLLLSTVGAFFGIWVGFKVGQNF